MPPSMAKVKLNSALAGLHGKLSSWVYRRAGDRTIVSPKPAHDRKRKISSDEQVTRIRLRSANSYALGVGPELMERYRAVARARHCPIFAVANRDFLNPPVIDAIDLGAYSGQPGQLIRIRAHDDFEVRDVAVAIHSASGAKLESGPAVRQPDDAWHYRAMVSAGLSGQVTIEVTARDWPEHATVRRVTAEVSAEPRAVETAPRAHLAARIRALTQRTGSFWLRSGATRVNFFDKYRLGASPALLREIAGELAAILPADDEAVAGLELGGVPVATLLAQLTNRPLLLLRKQARDHGTRAVAEGGDVAGHRVLMVADVVTTGAQFVASARALRAAGAIVNHAACVIDRQSGAPLLLQKESVTLTSLFTAADLQI